MALTVTVAVGLTLLRVTAWTALGSCKYCGPNARLDVERDTAVPVPVRATVCIDPPPLSVIVKLPVRLPTAVGANTMFIVQFAAALTVPVELPAGIQF